jgi:hypothetical protein
MEVNLETQHVEIDLNLPSWVGLNGNFRSTCVENGTFENRNFDAWLEWALDLGQIVCDKTDHKTACFKCHRKTPEQRLAA